MTRAIKIADQIDNEAYWLQKRFELITGSDVAAIMGLDKYCTPRKLFERKTNRDNDYVHCGHSDRGHGNEQAILDLYCAKNNARARLVSGLYQSQDYPWLGASPDSVALRNNNRALVEIKSPARQGKYDLRTYAAQAQLQMMVLGYDVCDVVIGIPSLVWFDPFDRPTSPLSYLDYMIAVGLPYYSPSLDAFVDPIHPAKARIVYNDIEIVPVYRTDADETKLVDLTRQFYDAIVSGSLPIELW